MSMPCSIRHPSEEEPPPPRWTTRLRRRLFRPRMLFWLSLIVGISVLGPEWVRALPQLEQRSEYTVPTTEIQITDRPHWVPVDFLDQVIARSDLPDEISLLDEPVLERLAAAFASHPWVAKVIAVRKSFGRGIVVELEYREPVAMVLVKQGPYPVAADGTLLPPADFSPADVERYPLVRNVTSVPHGPEGTVWGDPVVLGAAQLAEILNRTEGRSDPSWKRMGVAAIIAPNRVDAGDRLDDFIYELETQGGSRIIWGRAPGANRPGELTAEQKLKRMDEYIEDFGGLDHSHGPYEIDIRHWQEISRRPLRTD